MASAYAPAAQAPSAASTAPTVVPGYAVQDADLRWIWSATGPAQAGVVTAADGRIVIDTALASTWRVALGSLGAPILYGA